MPHQVQLTDSQWESLQQITNRRNPASVVRDLVEQFIRSRLVGAPRSSSSFGHTEVKGLSRAPVTEPSNGLRDRWVKLGINIRWHDKFLQKAFSWYIAKYPSEESALRELEHRHAHEQLHTPVAWLVTAYRESPEYAAETREIDQ